MRLRYLTKSPNSETYRYTELQYWSDEDKCWCSIQEVTCTDETYQEAHNDKDWDCEDGVY